jgi:hypothetical protein
MAVCNPSPTDESSWGSVSDGFEPIIITPPSLIMITPLLSSEFDSSDGSECDSEADMHAKVDEHYQRLIGAIQALHNKVEQAWVLDCLQVPLLHVPQLHLLEHFVVFQLHLFRKKNSVLIQKFSTVLLKKSNPIQSFPTDPTTYSS